jgi:hypothetical protein
MGGNGAGQHHRQHQGRDTKQPGKEQLQWNSPVEFEAMIGCGMTRVP